MSLVNQAKDGLKQAVGDVAEDNVDVLRTSVVDTVHELVKAQMEELLEESVAAAMAAVRDELHTFGALNLATRDDIVRLETLIVSLAGDRALGAMTRASAEASPRPAAIPLHPASTAKAGWRKARQA